MHTFKPAPGLPSAVREQLELDLRSVSAVSAKVPRKRSRAAVLAALVRHGETVLRAARPMGKHAFTFLYLSQGGEVLCSEFTNLTRAQRDALHAVSLDPRRYKPVRAVVFPSEAWVVTWSEKRTDAVSDEQTAQAA